MYASGVSLNIHEDERMKPENWIPLCWLPIIDDCKSLRPGQGYEGGPARNLRLQHECWKRFLSNGIHSDQQVLLLVFMVVIDVQLTYVTYRA